MSAIQFDLSRTRIGGCDSWQLTRADEDDRVVSVSSDPWTDDDGLEWGSAQVKAVVGWIVTWERDGDRWKAVRTA